ncbi:hypothetical protein ACLOJK_036274, partial [Asimina triloba]
MMFFFLALILNILCSRYAAHARALPETSNDWRANVEYGKWMFQMMLPKGVE